MGVRNGVVGFLAPLRFLECHCLPSVLEAQFLFTQKVWPLGAISVLTYYSVVDVTCLPYSRFESH